MRGVFQAKQAVGGWESNVSFEHWQTGDASDSSALLTTAGGELRDLRRHVDAVQFGDEGHLLTVPSRMIT